MGGAGGVLFLILVDAPVAGAIGGVAEGDAVVLLNNTLGKAHDYETFSIYFIVNALSRSLL